MSNIEIQNLNHVKEVAIKNKGNQQMTDVFTVVDSEQQTNDQNSSKILISATSRFGVLSDLKTVFEYSIPNVINMFSLNGIIFFNAFFVGMSNDSIALASSCLGFGIINIVMISFSDGIADGMGSLVSKCYGK